MDPDNYRRQFIINAVPSFGDVVCSDISLTDLPIDVSPKLYEELCKEIHRHPIRGRATFRCTIMEDGLSVDRIDSVRPIPQPLLTM